MAVTYEWDVEELDIVGVDVDDLDIIDHHFCDSYAKALVIAASFKDEGVPTAIVLVRNVGNDLEGLTDRAWAYVKDGKLPETFTYGAGEDSDIKVPKRFHTEVSRG